MSVIERSPRIETRRLALRAPTMSDAGRIAALANDLGVARMTTRLPHPYLRGDADAFLARMAALDYAREAVFAIELEQEGPIGVVGLHPSGSFAPEIGYWLGRPYWGRGFATEAARAALVWAHKGWGRRHVHARHFSDNPASAEVLCKVGFLYTGEVRLLPSRARGGEAVPSRMMVWLA